MVPLSWLLVTLSVAFVSVRSSCFEYPDGFTDPFDPRFQLIQCTRFELFAMETPQQTRVTLYISADGPSCIALHSDEMLDGITFEEPIVRSPNTPDTRSTEAIALCYLYAWVYNLEYELPKAAVTCRDDMVNMFNFPIPAQHPDILQCAEDYEFDFDQRKSCYEAVGDSEGWCPVVTGTIVAVEFYLYGKDDGWNAYGFMKTETRECSANCRNYYDYTEWNQRVRDGEITFGSGKGKGGKGSGKGSGGGKGKGKGIEDPRDDPANLWQPLLEDDGLGYFTRQEHVSPQVAVAKPSVVTRAYLEEITDALPNPEYDYRYDSEEVISVLNDLFVPYKGMRRKDIIEYMDNKSWVAASMINALRFSDAITWSFEEHLFFVWHSNVGKYDAVMAAWTAKLKWNLIRPTTVIQRWGDEQIVTWAGPYQNTGETIYASDFESYVRVMPHSEYPSGSACLCEVLKELGTGYLQRYKGVSDLPVVSTPPLFPGESRVEPGVEPPGPDPTFLNFDSITEFMDICGESRLWGAMHFAESVPAARTMCAGIGEQILDVGEHILNGYVLPSV